MINTSLHEITHEKIYKRYGCNSTDIKYSFFRLGGITKANCSLNEEKRIEMNNIHEVNEIVTYNLTLFSIFFFLTISALFLFIYLSAEKLNRRLNRRR